MLAQYGYVGIFLVIAVLIPTFMLLLSWLMSFVGVRPQKPSVVKSETYECGMETIGGSWVQFNFRYYYFALLFVIFDVETVFLYPWAVHFKQLALFGLVEMAVFMAILLVGYLYAWKKRALEWR
ncbi:MAG: NADH-quinone oxidoreductase subunit A [Dehalococcoidia bacterium]|nr:NADH-quinone oxidoreductase subunit A [Dehalococcoidia bacterium]